MLPLPPMLIVGNEVRDALSRGAAVVALESTIIAHGLPRPDNLEVARACESAVRASGAVPATIAVLAGRATVGLDAAELDRLAGGGFRKAGQADLARCIAAGLDAATTVSATTFLAARAGIRLFATGGIGGVHHGDGDDVSSDLGTIAREPVVVVSAGAKAILDLPRTLERLETLGVLVLGLRTDFFPEFYTRGRHLRLEHRVENEAEVAGIAAARRALGDMGGVLVGNPIPEEAALPDEAVALAIESAHRAAAAAGVSGKAITPFLLSRIAEATAGRSLAANRALVVHNALVAGRIAVELARIERR